ncbi:MAG: site-specific integrase [Methylovirgula sp.]
MTEEAVRKLQPTPSVQVDYFDALQPGLVLRVSYGGTKTWRALHYHKVNGKTVPRAYTLGRYPTLDLKQAREKARAFLTNPEAAREKAAQGSFSHVLENFLRRHVDANGLRSAPEIKRSFTKYVLPKWGERPFVDIRRTDVAALLDHVEDEHGPRQADLVLAYLRKLFGWYEARDESYRSPIVRGMRRDKPSERRRERVLSDDEIRAFWKASDKAHLYFGPFVRLLFLTAQRRDKVASLRWDEIDDGIWTVTTEAGEKGNAGTLPLPPIALDILEAIPRIVGNPFVFPGSNPKPAPINSFSQRKAELDAIMKSILPDMAPWTLHDLRRTARSLMSRAEVRSDIAERVLGHAIVGVEGVYDRHSYGKEKADALLHLAMLISEIVKTPGKSIVSTQP